MTRLYIPPRTRLETVFRRVNPDGTVSWHVWTACADRNAPFEQMLGTFMQLDADGMVTRVTLRHDDSVDVMEVMPKIGEEKDD